MSSVPRRLSRELQAFCRTISPELPVFIPSRPATDARPSNCYANVERRISHDGGQMAFGWAIWHVPDLYFEAEHHGVWRSPQGKLIDVSPQLVPTDKIVFLPDPTAVYDPGRFRPNIFAPDGNSWEANEFVVVARARNAIINRYRTNDGHIRVPFSLLDQNDFLVLEERKKTLLGAALGTKSRAR